jgi:hypothetical protein
MLREEERSQMKSKSSGRRQDWLTPLSKYSDLQFVKLIDDGTLSITLNGGALGQQESFYFKWHRFCAYRNTLEEHGGVPWHLSDEQKLSGCTHLVTDSSWISYMREGDDLVDLLHPNANHYVICSGDYVTEIISNVEPEIFQMPVTMTDE